MLLAVALGVGSAVGGYYVAAAFDVAISGTMAVVAGAFFTLALLFSPSRETVANLRRRRRNRRSFARDLLLVKLEKLGSRATEGDLVQGLNWDGGDVSEALRDASRRSFLHTPEAGTVALTEASRRSSPMCASSRPETLGGYRKRLEGRRNARGALCGDRFGSASGEVLTLHGSSGVGKLCVNSLSCGAY